MIRVVIAGLAATRLLRAYRFEGIGKPFRERLEERLAGPVMTATGGLDVKATVRREYLHELVTCPHCIGFWLTLVCVVGYRIRPARLLIDALAAAVILSAFVDHYPQFAPDPADED